MPPRTWITLAALALAATPFAAGAAPSLPLNVPQASQTQSYVTPEGQACLVLDAGRPLGDQDAAGLKGLIMGLDVQAGPGVMPETQPAGALLYTYNLVPELRGTRLIYRGLLSSARGNAVRVSARGPASLSEVVERNLGFGGQVRLVFSHQCN